MQKIIDSKFRRPRRRSAVLPLCPLLLGSQAVQLCKTVSPSGQKGYVLALFTTSRIDGEVWYSINSSNVLGHIGAASGVKFGHSWWVCVQLLNRSLSPERADVASHNLNSPSWYLQPFCIRRSTSLRECWRLMGANFPIAVHRLYTDKT